MQNLGDEHWTHWCLFTDLRTHRVKRYIFQFKAVDFIDGLFILTYNHFYLHVTYAVILNMYLVHLVTVVLSFLYDLLLTRICRL